MPLKGICDVFVFSRGSDKDNFIYDEKIVKKTLEALSNIDLLSDYKLYGIVNNIYVDGFGDKIKEFKETKKLFKQIIDSIVPFKNSNKKDSEFYNLFNAIEAIPELYRNEYINCIEKGKIFDAIQYCLQLTNGHYHKFLKEGRIDFEKKIFVNAKYDNELGLLINEEENKSII